MSEPVTDKHIQREIAYERGCLVALGLTLTESSTLADARAEYERVASGDGGSPHFAANLPISSMWHRAVKSRLANWAEWERERSPRNDHYSQCESCRARGLAVNTPPQVHIYGQHGNHDEAYIVGDRKGLSQLVEAIQKALKGLHAQSCAQGVAVVTARDGEGYAIYVVALSEERFAGTQLPYPLDGASPVVGRPPWSLVTHAPDETVLEDKEWFQHSAIVDDHRPVDHTKGQR